MADVTKIVSVSITRETSFPSSDSFGIGGIMAEFVPGNLNTPMQGLTGRYKRYTSLKTMDQDGWLETDPVYRAAEAYYSANPNPGVFVVGLRKAEDVTWEDTLDAVQAENDDWYGFSCILLDSELTSFSTFEAAIIEIADWAESKIKLFFFSTAQKAAIGELVVLSSGNFTSGKPGVLSNFQTITNGQFDIAKDGAAAVTVKEINLTAAGTPGEFESGSVSGNLASFQAVSDGEIEVTLDGGSAVDITGVDLSAATNFASVASILQTAIQGGAGLSAVTVVYDSPTNKMVFTSPTSGASSSIVLDTIAAPSGTDLTGVDYLNGGVSEPGQDAGVITSYDNVATAIQTAITTAGITGVTCVYDAVAMRFVFTSATTGKTSSVAITPNTTEVGDDLTAADYLNGGVVTYGNDLGAIPGTEDIGTVLKGQYDRTAWIYHEKARDAANIAAADVVWFEFAWMSFMFAKYLPAEATWAYKDLTANPEVEISGIDFAQDTFVRDNNGNTYTITGGAEVTLDGKVCGGEYLDIMRGTDWLQAKLVEGAYAPLIANPRVPFTDGGIGLEENAIRGVLTEAEINLLNAEYTELVVPKEADVSQADKAARNYPGFEFTATYQGAIQKVGISGTIGV